MEFDTNITVDDFTSICRLCVKQKSQLKPILKNEVEKRTADASLNQMITICLGLEVKNVEKTSISCNLKIFVQILLFHRLLQITSDDGLPLLICSMCCSKLNESHSFRLQCLSASDFLKDIKSKQEQNNSFDDHDWFVRILHTDTTLYSLFS